MSFVKKLIHGHHDHSEEGASHIHEQKPIIPTEPLVPPVAPSQPSPENEPILQSQVVPLLNAPPHLNPNLASTSQPIPPPQGYPPQPQVYIPPPPHINQSAGQNPGMMAGMLAGMNSDVGVGAGMVDGMMVGGMVNQRINQARSHAYWRDQAINYQAGLPAQGVGDPRVQPVPSKHPHRDERRRKRWERRARRHGVVTDPTGHSAGSGSSSDSD